MLTLHYYLVDFHYRGGQLLARIVPESFRQTELMSRAISRVIRNAILDDAETTDEILDFI